jgi:sigma-B regulation protein RsbU (phosphoserine phosphatase)
VKTRPLTSRPESELHSLFEFSTIVNSSLDLSFILDSLLLTLMGKMLTSKAVILLRTEAKTFSVANGKGVPKGFIREQIVLPTVRKRRSKIDASFSVPLNMHGINFLFPIISQEHVLGYFGAAENPKRPIEKELSTFIETLISISATAIEKGFSFADVKKVNRSLDEKVHQLKTLFELAKEFGGILDQQKLLKLFSLTLMGQVGTSRYAICLKEGRASIRRSPEVILRRTNRSSSIWSPHRCW